MTRLYVPATLESLAALPGSGALDATDAFVAADDAEESEYDALAAAADASAELVAGLPDGRRRRVVVVAEVTGEPDRVTLADVVAVHADPSDDADPDDDLGWYATQEIPDLLPG